MIKIKNSLLSFILVYMLMFFISCSQQENKSGTEQKSVYFKNDDTGVQNGGVKVIPVSTPKGTFAVWTKRIGNNPRIKVLLLHGGPGATHEYFECFESFLPAEGIEFIYYDQLGSGNSENPRDTSLWDLPRFVDEVEQVRKALGLNKDNYYLLGHSWGGIVAMEYALKYQDNLKGLIISDMMASGPEYGKYATDVLAKQMDPLVLDSIRMIEEKGDFQNPRYMALLMPNFYAKHICRLPLEQWPEPMTRSFSKMNQELYTIMQGPSEFGLTGKLTTWDIKAELPKISVPVLSIGAKYDSMDPDHMKRIAADVQNGSYLYCPEGSHMCMWDDQQVYMQGLIKFLKGVDEGKKKDIL